MDKQNTTETAVKEEVQNASERETHADEKLLSDIRELRSLFPEITPEDIPDEVWEKVKKGGELTANYALFVLKQKMEEERIALQNRKNEEKAPPRLKQSAKGEDYFSPETVRAMSPEEIRRHYTAILKSMDSWN